MTTENRIDKARKEFFENLVMMEKATGDGLPPGISRIDHSIGALHHLIKYIDAKFDEIEHGLDTASDIMKVPDDD